MLITSFSDDRRRARVLGLNGALLSVGFTVGALVGDALTAARQDRAKEFDASAA